jgi:hypothetical protein
MTTTIGKQIAELQRLGVKQLRRRYEDLFGEPTRAANKAWLVKRVAWRVQALAEGGLSERALARAKELANEADLRLSPPRESGTAVPKAAPAPQPPASAQGDDRLPPAGSVLARKYKGKEVRVTVLAAGFEYQGEAFPSLSAAAKAVTGSHCNGFLFFRLTDRETSA